jgi:hypothetical protein
VKKYFTQEQGTEPHKGLIKELCQVVFRKGKDFRTKCETEQ